MTADRELFHEYRRTRAPEVRDRLVEQHLPLVKYAAAWVAGRLPSHLRLDDLYSAGMLGFLDAVEHYDPDRGVPFSAYAAPRIRGAILDELRRVDCVPRRVRRKLREAQRAMEELAQELDREPTDEEMAARLGMDVTGYQRLLGEGVTLISLDGALRDEDHAAAPEGLVDGSIPSPLGTLEAREQRRWLGRLIETLPERERQVLALYYYEELTMQDIGTVLGVTESRVSQIHSGAVLRLRSALRRDRPRAAGGKTAAARR